MVTDAADPMDDDTDSRIATLERKRPHDVLSRDDVSNSGSAQSTPRKRAKYVGKLGHQDVRDFVPAGASFSTSAVPPEEAEDRGDEGSQADIGPKYEILSDREVKFLESDAAEQEKALAEGRRLLISDLPPQTTEENLKHFLKGYSIENMWFPDPRDDNSQLVTVAPKGNLSLSGDSSVTNSSDEAATITADNGRRLYVGHPPHGATVEDLRKFFRGFPLENVTIPVNPRTSRPVSYAFVAVSTSDEADRATSQLSGNQILGRRVSVQRARVEATKASDSSTTAAQEDPSTTSRKGIELNHGIGSVEVEPAIGEDSLHRDIPERISPQDAQTALSVNWNAVNTTKIRTTLRASVGKVKKLGVESSPANGGPKGAEAHSNRDLATLVALERVEELRNRLSTMDPHDDPVSAYKSAQQELHDAEVDYNYCLYFPADETFQPVPLSSACECTPKKKECSEYRFRIWCTVEQCMKKGTLQHLKDGELRVSSAESLGQPPPAQKSSFESLDGLEQTANQKNVQLSSITDPKQIQILESQDTFQKQSGYLQAFSHMKPGSHGHQKMKKRIHDTKIHLNYCRYFPITEDYLPLALAKKGVNELNSSNIEGIRASERRAAHIWKLVEKCTEEGTLQDLKDGRLDAWLKDAPPPSQSSIVSAPQRHSQEFSGMTGHSSKPQHGRVAMEASKDKAGAASANVKPTPVKEGNSRERQGTSESDGGALILNLEHRNQDMPSEIEEKDIRPVMSSRNKDEGIHLDVDQEGIKHELPAMNQVGDDLYGSDSGAASNSDTESNGSDIDSEGQSEDDDPMMQYSNSEQTAANEAERNTETITIPPGYKARILADLSPHDLDTQLKYFHTTKAREDVDGNTPVRCLVCAKEGHMAGLCEVLQCSICGAFNQHTTQACPNNAKCTKCREQGHDRDRCPYKLRKMPQHEIVCDLCQRNGHIEEDCELIWRTSGRPWESDLAHINVRLSCYECGHSGHLGNDCPSRKPNKPMGTSTWDGNVGLVSIKSTQEIKIKGKATQQDPINLDDSDDERANFYRPKISVPAPVRKGQIRIAFGRRESPAYEATKDERLPYNDGRYGSFTPVNESYRNDEARQQYHQYRDEGRNNWRAKDEPGYATSSDGLRYNDNYRPSDRRSRSPPYRDRGDYAGGSSWPPPRPTPRAEHQDMRPRADANVYRPMPSAAQSAWTRRRV